jgi:membrane protein YdbS with pleckstrin-like domain
MSEPASPERVVARLRPHGRALFWPAVALLLVVGAGAYFFGRFPLPWQNLAVLGAATLLAVLLWFVPVVRWLAWSYTITTRRTICRSGVFLRVRQDLLHGRAHDVSIRRTGMQSVFGSGDVSMNTGLDHEFVLRDVPRALLVQAALIDLIEANQIDTAARPA